jgi:N-methylhydantoinase B
MELADVEVLEAAYPILFRDRGVTEGAHGYGRFRSGAGCREAFRPHGIDEFVGNLTGTKAWFPAAGAAGGLPGATMRYALAHADGSREPLHIQAVGVKLAPGDHFELHCASGGGFGDPLDRDPAAVASDLAAGRIDRDIAGDIYGVVLTGDAVDAAATEQKRDAIRKDRLCRATPAKQALPELRPATKGAIHPLYPGVVQQGDMALAEQSGALLAVAPGNWLDGCPVLDQLLDDRAGRLVMRQHLDPLTGRILFADVTFADDEPGIAINPERWTRADTHPAFEEAAE